MAEVKFYLEKRKEKTTGKINTINVPILLFYSFNGKRLQYYSGYRIDASKWDEERMRVKKNYSEAADINRELTKLEAKVEDIHNKAKALGEKISPEYFRDRLNGKRKDAKNGDLIWDYYNEYLESLKVTHTKKSIKESTLTNKVLKDFSKERRWSMTFDSIDPVFWQEFFDWCYNTKGWFNNYTGSHIDKIKAFMNWSVKRGYTTTLEFRKVRRMQENTEIIYLTFDEVQQFMNHEFEEEEYAQMRDLYCLGCFTGLRYSDISKLLPENIHKDRIVYRVIKTKEPNIIPLNQYSRKILERNQGVHPVNCMPQILRGKISEYLKGAMKEAKLNRVVQIVHFKGAERFEESKPLWDAATFHTSKKTFVTNFLERGGSLTTAMAITGNKSYSVMRRYFKIADTFKAKEMERIFG
ncbi:MAG: site-specific integrase [Bacteroidetes bacterium]|nr:site-specific integrase [Bacteroidota bacterium]